MYTWENTEGANCCKLLPLTFNEDSNRDNMTLGMRGVADSQPIRVGKINKFLQIGEIMLDKSNKMHSHTLAFDLSV